MPRTIKFRAWTKEHGKWTLMRFQHRSTFWAAIDDPRTDIVDPEQWTGEHDMKGWEIYENDFIKVYYMTRDGDESLYRVDWLRTQWHLMEIGEKPFRDMPMAGGSQMEVIGNIHESPELAALTCITDYPNPYQSSSKKESKKDVEG